MKKYIFLLLFLFSYTLSAQNLKSYFISMPDSIIPLLTKMNREDCIDFLDSNMKAEVKNRFGKPSELKKITDNYLYLQTTPNSSVQMKMLAINDSTKIIGVIKTYKAKTYDSNIAFYSTDWKRLSTKSYIDIPSKNSFSVASDTISSDLPIQEIIDIMGIPLIKASFFEDSNDLVFDYTAPNTLDSEQLKGIDLKKGNYSIQYKWEDGRFVIKQ